MGNKMRPHFTNHTRLNINPHKNPIFNKRRGKGKKAKILEDKINNLLTSVKPQGSKHGDMSPVKALEEISSGK